MTVVYCFSGTGHSMAVAEFFREQLQCPLHIIGRESLWEETPAETAVIVFPVYCQNIPAPVKKCLRTIRAKYTVPVATYGGICRGNVLWDAQKLLEGTVIAGACVPAGHTFLQEDATFDPSPLLPVLERIRKPRPVCIPWNGKNPFSDFLPEWRSRVGVKLVRTEECNHCGLCEQKCPMGAMEDGIAGKGCIRCLHCVSICPRKALKTENRWILKRYLSCKKRIETVVYL